MMSASYLSAGTSSFSEFLTSAAPDLLPGAGGLSVPSGFARELPHGTTIVAAAFDGGVVMAGDRRATAGNMISQRDIEKVFRSDEYSCIGISGVAGIGIDLVRLFQVELEHYEKIEGRALSLEGKANRLAGMVRANLGGAMQGLVVVPIFAGYDTDEGVGRIFSYDVAGGRYEEHRFHSIGSGSVFARGSLKKLYTDGMDGRRCRHGLHAGAVRRRRRRLRHRWSRHDQADLPDRDDRDRGRLPAAERGGSGLLRAIRRRTTGCQNPTARPPCHGACRVPASSQPRPARPTQVREAPAVSMPFYVSPEQAMKDKADYARKGIARGRSGVVIQFDAGILFVAPNPSRALHKISEIYDRIAFAAVGRYNEYEILRKAGVRYADMTGYQYDRQDVTARGLANWYAQTLGTIFTDSPKPFEVEIVVAEVAEAAAEDQIYRITFDGSVNDEHGYVAMGGQAETIATVLKEHYADGMTLSGALTAAIAGLGAQANGDRIEITAGQLEVAVLDRSRDHRTFRRLTGARLENLLTEVDMVPPVAATPDAAPQPAPAQGKSKKAAGVRESATSAQQEQQEQQAKQADAAEDPGADTAGPGGEPAG